MTGEMTAHRRMTVMILDVLREIAAESGTGHIGSEHVALLAIRGSGGLAQLTGLPPDRLATALRRPCRLAGEIPLDRPTATTRTVRMVRSAIALAEMRGEPTPTAAELVGALLNEPVARPGSRWRRWASPRHRWSGRRARRSNAGVHR